MFLDCAVSDASPQLQGILPSYWNPPPPLPSCVLRAKHTAWHCEILYDEMTVLFSVTGSHCPDSRNVEFVLSLRLRL